MKPLLTELADRVSQAITRLGYAGDPLVRASQDEKFGEYQSNCAMGLARSAGKNPREVAAAIVAALDVGDICLAPEIAGPGFINFRLRPEALASRLASIPAAAEPDSDRIGIEPVAAPETVVVDLSSPNLAKEMHVGHLRSTVIGDCVARMLEFAGHDVIRENHVGDWGTQFGMLVAHLRRVRPDVLTSPGSLEIRDLESFYVEAKQRFDADEEFRKESRDTVVALQRGDEATLAIWKAFCDESLRHCHRIYDRLGIRLIDRGESYYNALMNDVVARLESGKTPDGAPLTVISDGALCMFLDGFVTRDGEPLPLIIRKSDGGYNYATSDLATVDHRIRVLGAKRIIYVVGLPQKQHFEMFFAAARKAGLAGQEVELIHLGFGSMLSPGGAPFKTREGGTVKLKDLLDEAVDRARRIVEAQAADPELGRSFSADQISRIGEVVGMAAVKYFDLSHNLAHDYRFDLDTMLSLEGNTAPYMLYAYARVRAIGRKAGIDFDQLAAATPLTLDHPSEARLALMLARFPEVFELALRELKPNVVTDYLFDLSKAFSRFYDKKLGVRVVGAETPELQRSRLRLCDLTARTLRVGLHLLGIEVLEQM